LSLRDLKEVRTKLPPEGQKWLEDLGVLDERVTAEHIALATPRDIDEWCYFQRLDESVGSLLSELGHLFSGHHGLPHVRT